MNYIKHLDAPVRHPIHNMVCRKRNPPIHPAFGREIPAFFPLEVGIRKSFDVGKYALPIEYRLLGAVPPHAVSENALKTAAELRTQFEWLAR
jgi:hypothetical protein